MRVFVTGATGFVGSAVVRELIAAGHAVLGLARSEAAAQALAAAGAAVHRGDLADPDALRRGAEQADGVVHTAFDHDFSQYRRNCEADRATIAVLGDALAGSSRPLVVTSAIGCLPQGVPATEDSRPASGAAAHPRAATEAAVDAVAARGVQALVLRLPPSVHGEGDHGFVPMLIGIARERRCSAMVGDGANRWPAVHRLDAARLYRRVLESGTAGARYHAVAEEGVPLRALAALIGRRLGVPVERVAAADAAGWFGGFAHFAAMDVPASSAWTQAALGWRPECPGLLADVDRDAYFAA